MIRIYRYSRGDDSFLMIDGRNVEVPRFRKSREVHSLCLLHNTSGLAIINDSQSADYSLEFYNADGAPGFCKAAAECSVAYADLLGVKPFHSQDYCFEAGGQLHSARILAHLGECKTISLDNEPAADVLCLGELD